VSNFWVHYIDWSVPCGVPIHQKQCPDVARFSVRESMSSLHRSASYCEAADIRKRGNLESDIECHAASPPVGDIERAGVLPDQLMNAALRLRGARLSRRKWLRFPPPVTRRAGFPDTPPAPHPRAQR
jgi:hypothetical protein